MAVMGFLNGLLTNDIGSTISDWLVDLGIPHWIVVVFIAMLPIVELRGALPFAILVLDMPWYWALVISIIGNLIPVPFILALFPTAEKILRRFRPFELFFDWIFKRTRKNVGKKVTRFRHIALILFVAIPLPITGAWTGCLVAYLYNLNRVKSFFFISMGVVIAGFIVLGTVALGISETLGVWGIVYAVEVIAILVALNRLLMKLE
jgi:uncharacterized membrane protein